MEAEYRLEVEVALKAGGVSAFTGSKPSPIRFSAMTFRYQYISLRSKNEFEPTTFSTSLMIIIIIFAYGSPTLHCEFTKLAPKISGRRQWKLDPPTVIESFPQLPRKCENRFACPGVSPSPLKLVNPSGPISNTELKSNPSSGARLDVNSSISAQ